MNAVTARRSIGAAALLPSVKISASPSSSRSHGCTRSVGSGAVAAARETSSRPPPATARCPANSAAPHASRYVLRDSRTSSGASFLAAWSSSSGESLLRLSANTISAWSRSMRARPNSSSGPASAVTSSARAASNAPAPRLAWAASSALSARRPGSPVSAAARRRNAAAAAWPPRAFARPAESSSSRATSSSGSATEAARCHARRSGSTFRSVTCASAKWAARRSGASADPYTAERASGWRNVTRSSTDSNPSVASTATSVIPSRSHARCRSTGSPTGSAAATSRRRRASSGRVSSRRR